MKFLRLVACAAIGIAVSASSTQAYFRIAGDSNGGAITYRDPYSPIRLTMLRNFYLGFHPSWSDWDRNLKQIAVLSDHPSRDFTYVFLRDKGGHDDFHYLVDQEFVDIDASLARVVQINDSSLSSMCWSLGDRRVPLDRPSPQHVFALRGFDVQYLDGDHRVDDIAIIEHNGTLYLTLHDGNPNDPVSFRVEYAWIPPQYVLGTYHASGHSSGGIGEYTPGTRGIRVISGFEFDFTHGAHDIADIGMTEDFRNDGRFFVMFGDGNGDDAFDWQVKWAHVY